MTEQAAAEPTDSTPETLPAVVPRGRRPLWWLVAAVAVVAVAAGLFLTHRGSGTVSADGTLTVTDATNFYRTSLGGPCIGKDGFDDLVPGVEVIVTDEHDTILAVGHLGTGTIIRSGQCTFDLHVTGIPAGHPLYGIQISHRGVLHYTQAQLGELALSVGGS